MAAKKDDKATVLAFEKKLVPSDGRMYGTNWESRHTSAPRDLKLVEKSVRGTISNRLSSAVADDPLKLNAAVENPNLQTVDSCALAVDEDTLQLSFTLKVLSGVEHPSACNSATFHEKYRSVAQEYIERFHFQQLAERYASNIANGRYLWRNRLGVQRGEVVVTLKSTDEERNWSMDPLSMSLHHFDNQSPEVKEIGKIIADALSGVRPYALFKIDTYVQVGLAQDVYPSEELVLNKANSKKSKVLYAVDETAALHSQKIGNALRTVDTWYPEYENVLTGPIALEPYGAVTNLGVAYRNPTTKSDFYSLFDKYARGGQLPREIDEHYVMGVLVRGGVFGESSK